MFKAVHSIAIYAAVLALPAAVWADITNPGLVLSSGQTLNLDTGAAGNAGDLSWDGTNLTPQGTATAQDLAPVLTGANGYSTVGSATLIQALATGLSSAAIMPAVNDVIVVKTNGGHYARLLVTLISGGSITLEFTTFGATSGTPGGPTIRSVNPILNAASYAYANLPNGSIAQGSYFAIFGSGLGPKTSPALSLPLQTTLGGVTVTISAGGKNFSAIPIYVSPTQINGIMPSKATVGAATVTVNYNGDSNAAPFNVTDRTVGLIALNSAGSGPGIITDANFHLYSLTSSAHPGDTSILWATGLGPVADDTIVPNFGPMNVPGLEVYVGLQKATVKYSGRGCCAGEDQLNIVIPQGVTGCHVPVAVLLKNSANKSVVSNWVTMPVAPVGQQVCSDASNSKASFDVSKLPTSGNFSVGVISLDRTTTESTTGAPAVAGQAVPHATTTTTSDYGSADFFQYTVQQLTYASNPFGVYTLGACTVFKFSGESGGYSDPVQPKGLDAGPQINVNGPNGQKTLPKDAHVAGLYDAILGGATGTQTLPLYLDAGAYTADNGSLGGADVKGFTARITRPQPLVWQNEDQVNTVVEANGQLVTWTGGDPNGTVEISGFSFQIGTQPDGSDSVGAGFVCIAPDSAGSFTIPAVVLLALPPSANSSIGGISIPTGSMSVGSSTAATFTATGLNYGYITSSDDSGKSVTYQ